MSSAWLLFLAGCIPTHSAFLRIPVSVAPEHDSDLVIVRVPIVEILRHMPEFDPADTAYYFRGRQLLAREYEDEDGDGVLDTVAVKLPKTQDEHWIVVVSPGESSTAPLPEGGSSVGVSLDFTKVRRE